MCFFVAGFFFVTMVPAALITHYGLDSTLEGQIGWKDTSGLPRILIPKLPTYQLVDEVPDSVNYLIP